MLKCGKLCPSRGNCVRQRGYLCTPSVGEKRIFTRAARCIAVLGNFETAPRNLVRGERRGAQRVQESSNDRRRRGVPILKSVRRGR